MTREECIDALTTTLRAYVLAIMDEAHITEDDAREVAAHCTRRIIYQIEITDKDTNP